jgi:group I intron endonuclease
MGEIYLAKNIANGKGYVGQTIYSLAKRQKEHIRASKRGSKLPFHMALRKHKFEWYLLEEKISEQFLDFFEIRNIHFFDSYKNGYNMTKGGDFNPSKNPEVAKKISKKMKGKFLGENSPNFGRPLSEETKAKISKTRKGKYRGKKNPMYGRKGNKHPLYGLKRPKQSVWMKKNNPMKNPKTQEKFRGDKNSAKRPEVRQKIRESWTEERRKEAANRLKGNRINLGRTRSKWPGAYYSEKKQNPWTRVWRGQIIYFGNIIRLGYFEDPYSIVLVVSLVQKELFGESFIDPIKILGGMN